MEPRADDGDDREAAENVADSLTPQWSPVLMTGTTGTLTYARGSVEWAAMEPRADDGDDRRGPVVTPAEARAAMEPRADDGDDQVDVVGAGKLGEAAMEPRADDGDDRCATRGAPVPTGRRNGAPC